MRCRLTFVSSKQCCLPEIAVVLDDFGQNGRINLLSNVSLNEVQLQEITGPYLGC